MKYYACRNASIKALVALEAIKGESIVYLSRKYHANRSEIVVWKQQLAEKLRLESWMVTFFTEQPDFLEKKKEEDQVSF